MLKNIFNKLKGGRKSFTIVFFSLVLILLLGILSPVIVQQREKNWNRDLSIRISEIQSGVLSVFHERERELLLENSILKNKLRRVLNPIDGSYGDLIRAVNNKEFNDFSIEVLAPNGKLIAWSSDCAIPQNNILPLPFPAGRVHFYNGDLITYLTVTDTILSDNDLFYYVVSKPIEKKYYIQNEYYQEISFPKELSKKYNTQFVLNYSPFAGETQDGRKYSFDLLNNQGNKIGNVTFFKPSLAESLESAYYATNAIQSILAVIAFFYLGLGFKKEFNQIKYRTLKIIILSLYCLVFRLLIYYMGFPSIILQGSLIDPSYYSSKIGYGMVKSPAEFFITALFALIICIQGILFLFNFLKNSNANSTRKIIWFAGMYLPLALIFLLTIRGLNAGVKSIVFDSTLRYFKEPNLIPNLPSTVMILNLLILGTIMLILLISYLLLLLYLLPRSDKNKARLMIFFLFISIQILGYIFIGYQDEPLITPFLSFIFITVIFILAYQIYFREIKNSYGFIYLILAASFISITMLNYFNTELEKESLKTTTLEINRPNDNLLRFLLSETLKNASQSAGIISDYYDLNSNFEADAFKLWVSSSLQRESLSSSIDIWDKDQKHLGGFNSGIDFNTKLPDQFLNYNGDAAKIIEVASPVDSSKKIFTGIIPLTNDGVRLGYVTASIGFDIQNLNSTGIPDFLESKSNVFNSVLDIKRLKIFKFVDSKLTAVYGNIYPSLEQVKPILDANLSSDNDAWLELAMNNDDFYVYVQKTFSGNTPVITAVLTREKQISWNLFNFFKIFLIHSIFILIVLLVVFLTGIKKTKYSFRTQLLIAFLFVAIIPVFVLAVYNRQVVKLRTDTAVQNELTDRLNYVVNIIKEELPEVPAGDFIRAFDNAGKDLGISYAVYEGAAQIYNSREQYYKAGLFTDKLNPEVYYQLNYLSFQEYLAKENVDEFEYDSYYKRVTIQDRPLIIGVNDAFNKVRLTYSVMDIDVFLFGVFSLATLIMIVLSAFLANRISLPIRRLTKATASVAHGDFNIELNNNEKGELKDLLNGFNSMTKELQKNQFELAELERENAWKEMAKQVAHEIKNPLTPMKLAVQQLIVAYKDKTKEFDTIFEKVSTTILNQIENLNQIASEFSRFARMPNFKLEKIDLLPIIMDTKNLFADEKIKIEIRTTLGSANVEADKSQFRRLMINLLRNSIQAGADKILISLNYENGYFHITINDNGRGIPENIRPKIFESNFTTKERGMGLGLKLAKRFIESINGSIILAEGTDAGTTFKVSLPIMQKDISKPG